jgi:ubiquinone/menaquinone biosynthesis C-methylase UbiE
MFGYYKKHILPGKLFKELSNPDFNQTRSAIVSQAKGVVLEIGFGSGFNIPFYNPTQVSLIYALEPSKEAFELARENIKHSKIQTTFLHSGAEIIPLPDNSVDTVVSTWVLCSVCTPDAVLTEIHRVLKPNGQFLFVEHGRSTHLAYAFLQDIVTPISKHFTGNCHLNRDIADYLQKSNLKVTKLESFPEEGRPLMYSTRGIAVKS